MKLSYWILGIFNPVGNYTQNVISNPFILLTDISKKVNPPSHIQHHTISPNYFLPCLLTYPSSQPYPVPGANEPLQTRQHIYPHTALINGQILTSIMILLNLLLHRALIRNGEPLRRQPLARRAKAGVIHGALEGVVLPAENVVSVLAESGARDSVRSWVVVLGGKGYLRITIAEDKGLGAIGRPVFFLCVFCGVPDNL